MTLEQMIELAARDLPDGHQLRIVARKGYADAILYVEGDECEYFLEEHPSISSRVAAILGALGLDLSPSGGQPSWPPAPPRTPGPNTMETSR